MCAPAFRVYVFPFLLSSFSIPTTKHTHTTLLDIRAPFNRESNFNILFGRLLVLFHLFRLVSCLSFPFVSSPYSFQSFYLNVDLL